MKPLKNRGFPGFFYFKSSVSFDEFWSSLTRFEPIFMG